MMGGMSQKKRPQNHRYSSFDAIEGNHVHLRGANDDESAEIDYKDAELISGLSGAKGARSGTFFIHSTGQTVPNISERQYSAWTRY